MNDVFRNISGGAFSLFGSIRTYMLQNVLYGQSHFIKTKGTTIGQIIYAAFALVLDHFDPPKKCKWQRSQNDAEAKGLTGKEGNSLP